MKKAYDNFTKNIFRIYSGGREMTAEESAAMERRARMFEAANEKMLADNKRLREENARLLKENSELIVRAHALLWHLPPEITCGELQKARDEMFAATIRESRNCVPEGGKDDAP